MEALARTWPGRTVALVYEQLYSAAGTLSELPIGARLEAAGMTVVPVTDGANWDEIARRVAGAARAPAN
jgi:hypothetical protein